MGTIEVKAALAAVLLAFGIVAPVPVALAGFALCMGGAYAAMIWMPPEQRGSTWATLVTALVIGLMAGSAHASLAWFSGWSFHLVMAGAGFLSRPICMAFSAFGAGIVGRAGDAAQSVKFPWEK